MDNQHSDCLILELSATLARAAVLRLFPSLAPHAVPECHSGAKIRIGWAPGNPEGAQSASLCCMMAGLPKATVLDAIAGAKSCACLLAPDELAGASDAPLTPPLRKLASAAFAGDAVCLQASDPGAAAAAALSLLAPGMDPSSWPEGCLAFCAATGSSIPSPEQALAILAAAAKKLRKAEQLSAGLGARPGHRS